MIEILWNEDLLPEEHKHIKMFEKEMYFGRKTGSRYVDKGGFVGSVHYYTERDRSKEFSIQRLDEHRFNLYSPIKGIVTYNESIYNDIALGIERDSVLYTIRTIQEEVDENNATYKIVTDPFTKEKKLEWTPFKQFQAFSNTKGVRLVVNEIYYDFIKGVPCLCLKIWRGQFKPKVKDSVSFLFDNGDVITHHIDKKPIKADDDFIVIMELMEKDFNLFLNHYLDSIRLQSPTAESVILLVQVELSEEFGRKLLQKYTRIFSNAIRDIGYEWEEPEIAPSTNEPCYVYLMVDTANGYHKIGISNHPEYREGTLQSEKPFIELVCAKKFPSRTIARAIESALHSTYQDKHLRGEWFQLDARDIIELTETLK